jgi:hypothetical protein
MRTLTMMLLLALLSPLAIGDEIRISRSELLTFSMPKGFDFQPSRDPTDRSLVLIYSHSDDGGSKDFSFRIFVNKVSAEQLSTEREKREFVAVDCEEYKEASVEKTVRIKKYKGNADVYYCSFTDASIPSTSKLRPGQFRNISIAFVREGEFAFMAVAYSNAIEGTLFNQFLNTMSSLNVKTLAGASS